MLFSYNKRFDEALKRGQVYWPGESIKKFGLQVANIEPIMVADRNVRFEYGQVIALDSDGRARVIAGTDNATNFYGVVHRNATATYGVLDEQIMGMAPRLTLSVFKGGRQGVIAVPVQNIFDGVSDPTDVGTTAVTKGGQVYIRVKALGAEADAWANDGKEYKIGGIVKHADKLWRIIKAHTSANNNASTPGHADSADKFVELDYTLPIGGIESVNNDETTAWTGVTFAELVSFPFANEKYRDQNGYTTAVAGIELG